jgi:capsular polysaccharide biosynthesis protein
MKDAPNVKEEINLHEIFHLLINFKKFIFFFTILFVLLVFIANSILTRPPNYTSSVEIQLGHAFETEPGNKYKLNKVQLKESEEGKDLDESLRTLIYTYPKLKISSPKSVGHLILSITSYSKEKNIEILGNSVDLIIKNSNQLLDERYEINQKKVERQISVIKEYKNQKKLLQITEIDSNKEIYLADLNITIMNLEAELELMKLSKRPEYSSSENIISYLVPKKYNFISYSVILGLILAIFTVFFRNYFLKN